MFSSNVLASSLRDGDMSRGVLWKGRGGGIVEGLRVREKVGMGIR
jgi:hypothetical protein